MAIKSILTITIVLLFSCTQKKPLDSLALGKIIQETVVKYDTVNFSKYYDSRIYLRGNGVLIREINGEGGCFVDNYMGLLIIKNKSTSLDKKEIKLISRAFLKSTLHYLKVDKNNNVFLNPFFLERAFMMRLGDTTLINQNHIITSGEGHYTKYKGNWYVSDTYIEKYDIKL